MLLVTVHNWEAFTWLTRSVTSSVVRRFPELENSQKKDRTSFADERYVQFRGSLGKTQQTTVAQNVHPSDFIEQVTRSVLNETMRKLGGKRRRRRRRLTPSQRILKQIEALLKPAKQQVSRKRTVRARSKVKQRAY